MGILMMDSAWQKGEMQVEFFKIGNYIYELFKVKYQMFKTIWL